MTRLGAAVLLVFCACATEPSSDDPQSTESTDTNDTSDQDEAEQPSNEAPPPNMQEPVVEPPAKCPTYSASQNVYTPYTGSGPFPMGSVSAYPWRGPNTMYP